MTMQVESAFAWASIMKAESELSLSERPAATTVPDLDLLVNLGHEGTFVD